MYMYDEYIRLWVLLIPIAIGNNKNTKFSIPTLFSFTN